MNTVAIVQARLASTRLPGKVMKSIEDKSMLEFEIERLRRSQHIGEVVVATTTNTADEPIVELCDQLGVSCFRGSEADVLGRYHGAAASRRADCIVRVTSDCPLIDPSVLDRVISFFHERSDRYDYVANTLKRTYPRGLDCEVFSFSALSQAFHEATAGPEREHVTPFIYTRPERFRLANVACEQDYSRHRWTVDTAEDLDLVRRIAGVLYRRKPDFTMWDCLELLRRHPEWQHINSRIEQKAI